VAGLSAIVGSVRGAEVRPIGEAGLGAAGFGGSSGKTGGSPPVAGVCAEAKPAIRANQQATATSRAGLRRIGID
jgi:hypothetical protein